MHDDRLHRFIGRVQFDVVRFLAILLDGRLAVQERDDRLVILGRGLFLDDDEITRTRKVRRRVINERYAAIIDALTDGAAEVDIKSLVTYQDGTNVTRNITLPIVSMDGFVPKEPGARRSLFGSHA